MTEETPLEDQMKCPNCGGRLGDCDCSREVSEADIDTDQVDEAEEAPPLPSPVDEGEDIQTGEEEPVEAQPEPEPEPEPALVNDTATAHNTGEEAETDDPSDAPLDMGSEAEPAQNAVADDQPLGFETPIETVAQPAEQGRGADGGGTADTEDQAFLDTMAELGDQPNVALFGFKTAGKTWLLHRLKQHLFSDLGADLDPDFETVPEAGQVLPGTSVVEFHDIVSAPPWTIIDTPGEYTRRLIAGDVEDMWKLVKVLQRATAVIITLPADTLVFGPQVDGERVMTPEARRLLAQEACGTGADPARVQQVDDFIKGIRDDYLDIERFAKGLFRAAATLSYVRHHNIDPTDPAAYADVTWNKVKRHCGDPDTFQPIGGKSGLDCPVFIALTKADRVVSVLYGDQEISGAGKMINARRKDMLDWAETKALMILAKNGGLLDDPNQYPLGRPSEFVRALAPELHTRLVKFCPMSRFDFVSAFFGHDYSTTLQYGHYRLCPQFGVDHMYAWIKDALGLSKKSGKRRTRQMLARRLHFAIHGVPADNAGAIYGGD